MVTALDRAARLEAPAPYTPWRVRDRDGQSSEPSDPRPDTRRLLARAFGRARKSFGDHGLAPHDFLAHAVRVTTLRRRRAGLPTSARELDALLRAAALEDLYLAFACERASEAAWKQVAETYLDRLTGLAVRRGARGADGEAAASAFLAKLALPPASGDARTTIGTFSATGSLWGWLAVGLTRHLQRESAKARRTQGEGVERIKGEARAHATPVEDTEVADAVVRALVAGMADLEPSERTAFVWKHRDALPQRRIAELLGVPSYQVSRWITRATTRLRVALEQTGQDLSGELPWAALGARVGRVLETTGVDAAQMRDE